MNVTGVQTCALPISIFSPHPAAASRRQNRFSDLVSAPTRTDTHIEQMDAAARTLLDRAILFPRTPACSRAVPAPPKSNAPARPSSRWQGTHLRQCAPLPADGFSPATLPD